MGGHAAGEVASRLAIESLAAAQLTGVSDNAAIHDAVVEANRLVFESASGATRGMGTTCALVVIGDGVAHIANVGDSRVYRMRGELLEQMTRDHTLVAEMVDQGLVSAADAMLDGSSQITRALGGAATVEPDVSAIELQPGDRFVICSDGLSGMINDDAIGTILLRHADAQQAAQALVDAANQAGGEDNVTAVIVNVDAVDDDASAESVSSGQQRAPARGRWGWILMLVIAIIAVIAAAILLHGFS